ncbi:MAG: transporter [Bacteroidetes bacterium HGW-Bacteroidetes-2]|jgi:long-subunit fatty acid transport protein|nr:MAG: transporter [Bacteroidetes bacterium HGW-Bacteroidetes-2]
MKRNIFLLIAIFVVSNIQAQSIIDGLRYSKDGPYGTARFSAMSGAFGALGGDLTAIHSNPAGSAVFLENTASVSLSFLDTKNETNYFNTTDSNFNSEVSLNQAGIVFVFDNHIEDSSWKKFTLGLSYETTNNFDNDFFAHGQSNSSIDSYFLNFAQGIPLNLLQLQTGESISDLYRFLGETEGFGAQQAFLGFQSFLLDPTDPENPDNTTYFSNIAPGNFNQEFSFNSSGYNAKYTINLATQINNIYIGLNLNSHLIDYRESTFFFESNNNEGSLINEVGFQNNLVVLGNGFSAQFGAIAKVSDYIRIGLSYDTPTWYTISEETTQQIDTRRTENGTSITERIRPNIINIFEDYKLRSPGKLTGSMAYLFGKEGLLSVDYSYKDYSNIQFSPLKEPLFNAQNSLIDSSLKGSSSIKLGGEYRWNQVSFRSGFQYEQSPYANTEVMGNLTGFSLGLGYNFGSFRLDAAYARTEQDRNNQLFQGSAFTNTASINSINNFFTLTTNFLF